MGPNLLPETRSGAITKRRHHILLSSAQSLSDELLRSKKSKRTDLGIAVDDVSTRAFPVKDLRSRRIFSPAKSDGDLGFLIEDPKSLNHVDLGSAADSLCNAKGDGARLESNGIYKGKDSNSRNKLVVKSSLQRKVFKVPGSHSYCRLLPFLMDMAKDDTCSFTVSPCIAKTEKIGLGPHKSKDEGICAHSDGIKALENEEMKNCGNELAHEARHLNELNLSNTVRDTRSHEDLKGNENGLGSNRVLEFTDEHNVSKVDEIDLGISPKSPKPNDKNPKCLVDSSDQKDENEGRDGLQPLENGNIKNLNTPYSCEALDMDQLNLFGSEEGIQLGNNDQKGNENGGSSHGTDTYTKGNIQTTHSDMNIFSNPEINMVETEESPKDKFVMEDNSFASGNAQTYMDQLNLSGSKDGLKKAFNSEDPDMDQCNLSGSGEGFQLNDPCQIRNESTNRVDEYTEDHIQTTPPEMNNFSNLKINMVENDESPKEKIVIENDSIVHGDAHKDIFLKRDSTSKKKVVLNPCSRRKVFKTPGSFSYRRLLPYLMEVSNENPHNSSDASKYQQRSKIKTDIEEKKTLEHLPMVDINCQQPLLYSKELISNTDSSENKLTFTSSEKSIELQNPFDSPNKSIPVEQIISDIIKDLDHASGSENPEIDLSSPARLSCSGDNDDAQSKSSQGTKALQLESLNPKLSQVEESFPCDNPVTKKSILRRNPRGCRGLCNCLNCTSFRLNAERAFEFSRNQMLDAEEVALDLIKELSSLRNMLKESTVNPNGQVTADIDQVTEACTKALKAEELAKCRLKEMHSDLTAHCRSKLLERPTVRFSKHNKEMVITKVD